MRSTGDRETGLVAQELTDLGTISTCGRRDNRLHDWHLQLSLGSLLGHRLATAQSPHCVGLRQPRNYLELFATAMTSYGVNQRCRTIFNQERLNKKIRSLAMEVGQPISMIEMMQKGR